MTPSRKKLITSSVLLLGVGVVVVVGITLYPSLRERYWIWKLGSEIETERLKAAEILGELGSVRAIPSLIQAAESEAVRFKERWEIFLPGSRLIWRQIEVKFIDLPRLAPRIAGPLAFHEAIRKISQNRRGSAEKTLTRLLSDENELFRAVAASILFEGTDRAKEYVSRERIGEFSRFHF